jgi:hypothetical protein
MICEKITPIPQTLSQMHSKQDDSRTSRPSRQRRTQSPNSFSHPHR